MKKYIALKASAGSGKTFALTVRYITLLLLGAKPHEILTLTFTNKAANEMSERIYQTLLTLGDDEAYLESICAQSGLDKKEILGKKIQLVRQYTSADLSIYTIDKFVNKILREFCGYVGVSDDFEIREDNSDDLNLKFLKSLDLKEFDKLIDFSLYENKKFGSLTSIFKILIEKNEKIDLVKIDSELISLQKTQVLNAAFKVKEFILNTDSTKSAINAVDFDSFDSLLLKGKTWLAKESTKDFS
ncbi:MAG: UvrD-helicase domain-containing protein, partial [Campylobacteraceae bacterium]|nr:UvrD-helicase domain-containing protein [Campylobacteraceae bacterium]